MKVLRRIAAAALVSSSVLGTCGWYGYGLTSGFIRLSAERRRAETAVRGLERMVALVRDAESGQRGYLLTEDEAYLSPYTLAVARVDRAIAGVERSDVWPAAESRVVTTLARAKMAELRLTVDMAQRGRREAALRVVKGGEGRALMVRMRAMTEGMAARTDGQIAAREAALERSASQTLVMIPVLGVLSPLVAFGSVASAYLHYRHGLEHAAQVQAESDAAVLRAEVEAGLARNEATRNADLLNALSHDLKTPLNAIGLNVQLAEALIRAGADPDEVVDALGEVGKSVRSQADMLDGFLEVTRSERSAVQVGRFRLGDVLDDVAQLVRPEADRKGLTLTVEVWPPAGAVTTDRRKLKQIVLNLASNAVKFTESGSVLIRGTAGEPALVEVVDTGPGVPAALVPRLFSDFTQGGNAHRDPSKGFGLGLAISRRLAYQIGATIRVDRNPAGGAVFSVEVPDMEVKS